MNSEINLNFKIKAQITNILKICENAVKNSEKIKYL